MAFGMFWVLGVGELLKQPAIALWSAWGPAITDALAATSLSTWKGGKAIDILTTRGPKVFAVALNTLAVLPYVLVLPAIDRQARSALLQRFRLGRPVPLDLGNPPTKT